MHLLPLLLLALLSYSICSAQTLIRNTTVLDVERGRVLKNHQVLVLDGKIVSVSSSNKQYKLPAGTEVIDGTGKFLVPGFVDAHVHFFQSGGIYTRPDVIDLRAYRPYAEEIEWTHRNMDNILARYIRAGITSVVDVGSTLRFLQQRDTFAAKKTAPLILMTGPLLTTWEPPAYKNLGMDAPFTEMKTAEDARRFVQGQLPYKPDFIKIWYIVTDRDTEKGARANLPLIEAAIDEAHKNGLRVAVHATERITAQLAVGAGADFLVHGIDNEVVDAAFLQLLKTKGTVVSPTLVVGSNYGKALGQQYTFTTHDHALAPPAPLGSLLDLKHLQDTALTARYRRVMLSRSGSQAKEDSILRLNTAKMLQAGIPLALGTDAGNIGTQHVSSFYDELQALESTGLRGWALLRAATINGARLAGKEKEWGSIREGALGNMVLLHKDPLESSRNWQEIHTVINKGVALRPDSVRIATPEALAQQQLNAYNAHDLEAFLAPYAEDVTIYGFPDRLRMQGKEAMRKAYAFLTKTPALHCVLQNRIVQGNTVIDHEMVYGFGDKPVFAVAIYSIRNGKIQTVHFIQ